MDSKSEIISELENSVEGEFDYHGNIGSINAHVIGRSSARIGHLVVKKDERRNGYGGKMLESMLKVLNRNGYTSIIIEIQSNNSNGENDSVMEFLRNYNFIYQESFQHHNWGDCIRARK